jgi:transcriptional/translational regulatory protein YebC/TACO1
MVERLNLEKEENETLVSNKAFTRIEKTSIKEGGPNPDANSRLRAVIQNSKGS